MKQYSFKERAELLRKINAISHNGKRLSEIQTADGYNVWLFFQTRLFFDELRERRVGKVSRSVISTPKYVLMGLLAAGITLLGFIYFLFKRPKVALYSVDKTNSAFSRSDARLDDLYGFLVENGVSYGEYFHSLVGYELISKFIKRKRLAVYIRTLDFVLDIGDLFNRSNSRGSQVIDVSGFDEEDQEFITHLVRKYLREVVRSELKVKILRKILRLTRPEVIWGIDNTRDYNELVLAAALEEVPFFAFQHGHFTKYHRGWLVDPSFTGKFARPDKLYVWSTYWKNELLRLGTYFEPEEIVVGGIKKDIAHTGVSSLASGGGITVLVPYEVDAMKKDIKKYIDTFLQDESIKVVFKLRSDRDELSQLREYGLTKDYHPRFEAVSQIKDYSKVSVMAGTYSTLMYDVVRFNIPLAFLETDLDFGEPLVVNGLADKISFNSDPIAQLRKIAETSRGALEERRVKLYDAKPVDIKDTLQSITKAYSL